MKNDQDPMSNTMFAQELVRRLNALKDSPAEWEALGKLMLTKVPMHVDGSDWRMSVDCLLQRLCGGRLGGMAVIGGGPEGVFYTSSWGVYEREGGTPITTETKEE